MDILIKQVELNGQPTDIHIKDNLIHQVALHIAIEADQVIDGKGKAIIPGLINLHTHTGMTNFRGFGDDMPLMPWLEEKIWPYEAKMTDEDVYWGAKLACLEMIKTGTTAFADMYMKMDAILPAVEEMGLRAQLAETCFDHFNPTLREKAQEQIMNRIASFPKQPKSDRISLSIGPHAIYTVSGELLQWINQVSEKENIPIHLHLSETEKEVNDSIKNFGHTPVRYLKELGVLSPRLMIAHGLYIDDEEIQILADYGVKVVHNPASNMKLGSGIYFKFKEMKAAGLQVGIGTDSTASSNNLDMVEAMKLASLLGKGWRKDPEVLTCDEVFEATTSVAADIMGIKAGRIQEGYLADICLIDLQIPAFTPNFNTISNLVYAANGSCIDTVICDGKILMSNKHVEGEEEILRKASEMAYKLMKD